MKPKSKLASLQSLLVEISVRSLICGRNHVYVASQTVMVPESCKYQESF